MHILLISDIHANWPALQAVLKTYPAQQFDYLLNTGDTTVYAPYPNETIAQLAALPNQISILGNTDKKVLKLIAGKNFKKPSKAEKRELYLQTAQQLTHTNLQFLQSLPKKQHLNLAGYKILLCHGK